MVLPFKLLGGEPSQSYIAEGLTSGVTQDLGRIRDAFVLPATTAYAYRDKALTIPALAQDAGVRFVLTGEVQLQGQRLRIRAQLADGAADRQVWSEVFEGELTQLFELQDQITARIANSTERQMVVLAAGESQRKRSTPQGADLALQFRATRLQFGFAVPGNALATRVDGPLDEAGGLGPQVAGRRASKRQCDDGSGLGPLRAPERLQVGSERPRAKSTPAGIGRLGGPRNGA